MQNQEKEEKEILLKKKAKKEKKKNRVQNLKQEEKKRYDSPGEKKHPNNWSSVASYYGEDCVVLFEIGITDK